MNNKLLTAKKRFRETLTKLKVKLNNIDSELENISHDFENLMDEMSKYQSQIDEEFSKKFEKAKIVNLEKNENFSKIVKNEKTETPQEFLNIAASVGIWEILLRAMTRNADDFRTACDAVIFKAVHEKIVSNDKFCILTEIPPSATVVIQQGRELLSWLREEFDTYLTYEDVWPIASGIITDWWIGTGLPLLYGKRNDSWDTIEPYTLEDMETWKKFPANAELQFAEVTSAYNFWTRYGDEVRSSYGLDDFEIKTFSF